PPSPASAATCSARNPPPPPCCSSISRLARPSYSGLWSAVHPATSAASTSGTPTIHARERQTERDRLGRWREFPSSAGWTGRSPGGRRPAEKVLTWTPSIDSRDGVDHARDREEDAYDEGLIAHQPVAVAHEDLISR